MKYYKRRTPYYEQLEDERWKTKRYDIITRDHHRCKMCGCNGSGDNPLEVHHRYYVFPHLNAWEYDDSALVTLCFKCHRLIHMSLGYLNYVEQNGQLVLTPLTPCKRCGGTGYLPEYRHVQHGLCFRCSGKRFEELIELNNISIIDNSNPNRMSFDVFHQEMTEARAHDIISIVDSLNRDSQQDYRTKAYNYLYKAAINGYKESQYRIGALLLWKEASENEDISSDKEAQEALVWFSYAAMQGDIKAQMMLSVFFKIGVGVKQNETCSKAWESISCHNDDDIALCSRLGYAVSFNFRSRRGRNYYASTLIRLCQEGNIAARNNIELINNAINKARERKNE